MRDRPNAQPVESEQQHISPYVRPSQGLLTEMGARATAFFTHDSVTPQRPMSEEAPVVLPDTVTTDGELALGNATFSDTNVLSAVGKARTFLGEQTKRVQQEWNNLRSHASRANLRRTGSAVLAGMAATVAHPFVEAAAEKVPVIQKLDQTPSANAAEILQRGTTSYPWLELEQGGEGCALYAYWALLQNGVPEARTSAMGIENAPLQFETVDTTPAPGSIGQMTQRSGENHYIYVESVEENGNVIVFSDFNGWGGPNEFSRTRISMSELNNTVTNLHFIHLEFPPIANGDFIGTGPDKRMEGGLSTRNNNLYDSKYITSANGRFILLFNKGNLATYDKQNNFAKTWQSGTSGDGSSQSVQIEIKGKGQSNSLTIRNDDGDLVWSRKIGIGTNKLTVNDDGRVSLYRGNTLVASGKDIDAAAKAASSKNAGSNKNKVFGAEYARRNKDSISRRFSLTKGTFIKSKNGKFWLVYAGNKIRGVARGAPNAAKWQARVNRRADVLRIEPSRRGNKLVARNASRKYRSWNIGSATRVTIANTGNLVGLKGRKKVWEARTITAAPRAAKAAAKKASQQR